MAMFDRGNDPLAQIFQRFLATVYQNRIVCYVSLIISCGFGTILAWNMMVDWYVMRHGILKSVPVHSERDVRNGDDHYTEVTFRFFGASQPDKLRILPVFGSLSTGDGFATMSTSGSMKSCSRPNPMVHVRYLADSPGTFVVEWDRGRNVTAPFFCILCLVVTILLIRQILQLDRVANPQPPQEARWPGDLSFDGGGIS
ncbi:MAG: hypothetical protein KDA96_26125 [Planctomycetaceae bacterium]|nr:hypothetical protein [Planctomycetaceae bacterium]